MFCSWMVQSKGYRLQQHDKGDGEKNRNNRFG